MTTLDHPEINALRGLLDGRIADDEAESLEAHLLHCAECLEQLKRLEASDPFGALVASQTGAAAPLLPEGIDVAGLVRRVQAQRQETPIPDLSAARTRTAAPDQDTGRICEKDVRAVLAPGQEAGELGRLGPYRVLEILGEGGMGVVFRAEDTVLKRPVGLKVMRPKLTANEDFRRRFLRETQLAASLNHENVITIHQAGEDRSVLYCAMELLQGESLAARMKREGRLPIADVIQICREIALGLAAAHAKGLVHRDIKPANIFLAPGPDAQVPRVKVLDFGLARHVDDTGLSGVGVGVGTVAYMSLEQARGEAVDHRADLFSLGCILYAMTTGELPFTDKNITAYIAALMDGAPRPPHELNPEVPPALSELIVQLLAKKPEDRPASAADVAQRLGEMAAGGEEAAQRLLPAVAGKSRLRFRFAVAAAAALLLLGTGAWFYAPTVVRFATNKGVLIVEVDDPDVKVSVKQGDVIVEDSKTNRRFVLTASDGQVEFYDAASGVRLLTKEFKLERGGETVVRARQAELARGSGSPTGSGSPSSSAQAVDGAKRLEEVKDATVCIELDKGGWTSGFVFLMDDESALIATAYHEKQEKLSVVIHAGTNKEQSLPAELIASDPVSHVNVLNVSSKELPKPLALSQRVAPHEAMNILTIGFAGNPFPQVGSEKPTVSFNKGYISTVREDSLTREKMIDLDGELSYGHLGGPVVDADGNLVGIALPRMPFKLGACAPLSDLTALVHGRIDASSIEVGVDWIESGSFRVQVEVWTHDPRKKIRDVNVRYVRQDALKQAPADDAPLPNSEKLSLKLDDDKAHGEVTLKGSDKKAVGYLFQISYVNSVGKTVVLAPVVRSLDFGAAEILSNGTKLRLERSTGRPPPEPKVGLPTGKDLAFALNLPKFLAARVDAKSNALFITTRDGELQHYSYPEFKLRGTYVLPGELAAYQAALDPSAKLLYLALTKKKFLRPENLDERIRGGGDIVAIDYAGLSQGSAAELKLLGRCGVNADVRDLSISPSGDALYFLDVKADDNVQLVKIDAKARKLESQLKLADKTETMVLTPDGKTVYAGASPKGHSPEDSAERVGILQKIDAAKMKLIKSINIAVDPWNMIADNEGTVYVTGGTGHDGGLVTVDMKDKFAVTRSTGVGERPWMVQSADGEKLYFSITSKFPHSIADCLFPPSDSHFVGQALAIDDPGHPIGGRPYVSPDGTCLILPAGSVWWTANKEMDDSADAEVFGVLRPATAGTDVKPAPDVGAPTGKDFALALKLPAFLSAQVDPKSGALFLTTPSGGLRYFGYPDFKHRADFILSGQLVAYQAALDGAGGMLYLAVTKPDRLKVVGSTDQPIGLGDILAYDVRELLRGKGSSDQPLKPVTRYRLRAPVHDLTLSPDGSWLYFLDVKKENDVKLVKINTKLAKVEVELKLSDRSEWMCFAPDGKAIYVTASPNAHAGQGLGIQIGLVQEIDPTEMKLLKRVKIPFDPWNIAAQNDGTVYLTGGSGETTNLVAIDMNEVFATTGEWRGGHRRDNMVMSPDGTTLYLYQGGFVGGEMMANHLPLAREDTVNAPGLERAKNDPTHPVSGRPYLTPDGKCILSPGGSAWWTAVAKTTDGSGGSAGSGSPGSGSKGSGSATSPEVVAPTGKGFVLALQLPRSLAELVDLKTGTVLLAMPYGAIRQYSYPDFKLQGEYWLPDNLAAYRMAFDSSAGLVYLAVAPAEKVHDPFAGPYSGDANILVIDLARLAEVKREVDNVLKPAAEIKLEASIRDMVLSRDGGFIYFLDTKKNPSVRLVRVNTRTKKVDGELELADKTEAMSMTPDGKTLYAIASPNGHANYVTAPLRGIVQRIDAAELKLAKKIVISADPEKVAATNDGMVFVASGSGQAGSPGAYVVDMRDTYSIVKEMRGFDTKSWMKVSPDGRWVYALTTPRPPSLLAWTMPEVIDEKPLEASSRQGDDQNPPMMAGEPCVTPDNRFILCPAGNVYWTPSASPTDKPDNPKGSGSRSVPGTKVAPPEVGAATGKNLDFAVRLPRSLAVQVDPKGGALYMALPDGAIRHYSYPEFRLQGEYRLPDDKIACHAALDAAKGLLYLAVAKSDKVKVPGNPDDRVDAEGDIIAVDVAHLADKKKDIDNVLKPVAEYKLGAVVRDMYLAPSCEFLYFMDIKDATKLRLVRINTKKKAVEGEVELVEKTETMCITSDGKALYAIASPNGHQPNPASAQKGIVQKIDAGEMKLTKKITIAQDPANIAATDDGMLFISGGSGQATNLSVVDMKDTFAIVQQWGGQSPRAWIKLSPDSRWLYSSTMNMPRVLQALALPGKIEDKPLAQKGRVDEDVKTQSVSGESYISPDNKCVVLLSGWVYWTPAAKPKEDEK